MTERKLIPFDLERALAGDAVVTRNGKKAKVVFVSHYSNEEWPVLTVIDLDNKHTDNWCDKNGRSSIEDPLFDLFMTQKTKTVWINIFKHDLTKEINSGCYVYDSKEIALKVAANSSAFWIHLKTISVEIEI